LNEPFSSQGQRSVLAPGRCTPAPKPFMAYTLVTKVTRQLNALALLELARSPLRV